MVVGLDRIKKTPCGFCFVEYTTRESARNAMRYVNGTKLDDRQIRTDWDTGFEEGRQFGRSRSGGQVRDEYRDNCKCSKIQCIQNLVNSSIFLKFSFETIAID